MNGERDGRAVALAVRTGSGFEALVGASVLVAAGGGGTWPNQLAGHQALAAALVERTGDRTGELWRHLLAAATDLPGEPDPGAVADWLAGASPLRTLIDKQRQIEAYQ